MKVSNFIIMFMICMLGLSIVTTVNTKNLDAMTKKQIEYNNAVDTAVEDAAQQIVNVDDNRGIFKDKDTVLQNYFASLYANLGALSDSTAQTMIQLYTPVFAIIDNSGCFINYCTEATLPQDASSGAVSLVRTWSCKYPYGMTEGDFVYSFRLDGTIRVLRKSDNLVLVGTYKDIAGAHVGSMCDTLSESEVTEIIHKVIIDTIEKKMSYFINKHNDVANSAGLDYKFSMPVITDASWSNTIKDTSLLAIFQGYPYKDGIGGTYNKMAFGAARVTKSARFYLYQSSQSGVLMYHKSTCPDLAGLSAEELASLESYNSKTECARHGAYYCEVCKP